MARKRKVGNLVIKGTSQQQLRARARKYTNCAQQDLLKAAALHKEADRLDQLALKISAEDEARLYAEGKHGAHEKKVKPRDEETAFSIGHLSHA